LAENLFSGIMIGSLKLLHEPSNSKVFDLSLFPHIKLPDGFAGHLPFSTHGK
jgi:hypothetical protein